MPTLEYEQLNYWDQLDQLVEGIDVANDDDWGNFIDAFVGSLSILLMVDKVLIESLMRRRFPSNENPFPGYFATPSVPM